MVLVLRRYPPASVPDGINHEIWIDRNSPQPGKRVSALGLVSRGRPFVVFTSWDCNDIAVRHSRTEACGNDVRGRVERRPSMRFSGGAQRDTTSHALLPASCC